MSTSYRLYSPPRGLSCQSYIISQDFSTDFFRKVIPSKNIPENARLFGPHPQGCSFLQTWGISTPRFPLRFPPPRRAAVPSARPPRRASSARVTAGGAHLALCTVLFRRKAFFTAFRFFFRAEALHQFTHGDTPLCLRFEILHTLCKNRIVQARCLRLEEILHQPSERRILLAFAIDIEICAPSPKSRPSSRIESGQMASERHFFITMTKVDLFFIYCYYNNKNMEVSA